jgi:hypothetical protein
MDPPLHSRKQNPKYRIKHPISHTKKKFKTQPSLGRVLIFLWDAQEPILEHYQERPTTVNSVHYSEMVQDHLNPATQTKHRGLPSKGVAMLHSNARLHTAAHSTESLHQLYSEVLKHPP